MRNKISIILLLTALIAASCTKLPGARRIITVRVNASETKGSVTTTESLVNKSGEFTMNAYATDSYTDEEGEEHAAGLYIASGEAGGNVRIVGGDWTIAGGDYYWISETPINFWAWHPVTTRGKRVISAPSAPDATSISFSYTTPAVDETHPVDGETDADRSEDILFAFTSKAYDGNDVGICFRHALASVRFCVSTNDGTFDPGLEIEKISISSLNNSGSATFTDNAKDGAAFTWSSLSGSCTFGQVYNAVFTTLPAEGWTAGTYESRGSTYDLHTCQNVFFMIPQTVTADNSVTILFKYKGIESEVTRPLTGSSDIWQSGYYYTYKIKATTLDRDIDASIELMGWSNRDDKLFI